MDDTPNLNLPYIAAAQAQKHVTHNEAIRALDAIVQLAVIDKDIADPPASPVDGERYIAAAGATGAWTGKDGQIAAWQDGAWMFYAPEEGWIAWVADENRLYAYDGTVWGDANAGVHQNMPLIGINTTADTTNRLAVSSPATLFNHEGDNHQVKINKNAAVDTASVLFQTGFSGRAEFGLTGDDDWHVKVSADGNSWKESVKVDRNTGDIALRDGSVMVAQGEVTATNAGGAGLFRANRSDGKIAVLAAGGGAGVFIYDETGSFGIGAAPRSVIESTSLSASYRIWCSEPTGNVGIGTTSPQTRLDVDGPVRVKSYTVATLPSASTIAGAIVYVSDETAGAVLAFSDGTNWRRVTDRAVVS